MPDVVLGALSQLAKAAAKAGVKRLLEQPPVAAAIETAITGTAGAFPGLEGVEDHLRQWCRTDEFSDLLTQFDRGDRAPQSNAVVSSFVRATGFFDEERTHATATALLHLFASRLEVELLKSPQGLAVLAAREEAQHRKTQAMIGSVLDATAEQDASLGRTRCRFGEAAADIYRQAAILIVTGADSVYHHDILTKYVAAVAKMDSTPSRLDAACRQLAVDILDRISTVAGHTGQWLNRLEHLRESFGYALSAPLSVEFERMRDALAALVDLEPPERASHHREMKQRQRVPVAIARLHDFIEHAGALDTSFRQLFQLACGRPCDEATGIPATRMGVAMDWYREYLRVLTARWSEIAGRMDLGEDAW